MENKIDTLNNPGVDIRIKFLRKIPKFKKVEKCGNPPFKFCFYQA